MKIGIIVYSHTGNTLSVAKRMKEKLAAAGHCVSLQRVSAANDEEIDIQKIRLNENPDINAYDLLILGAPVRAFALSPVMKAYLLNVQSLAGKKVACFLTQHFPSPWLGGNRALKQIIRICQRKGANPYETGIVNWSNTAKRERLIEIVAERLCNFD